jgi:hypothetical protein
MINDPSEQRSSESFKVNLEDLLEILEKPYPNVTINIIESVENININSPTIQNIDLNSIVQNLQITDTKKKELEEQIKELEQASREKNLNKAQNIVQKIWTFGESVCQGLVVELIKKLIFPTS